MSLQTYTNSQLDNFLSSPSNTLWTYFHSINAYPLILNAGCFIFRRTEFQSVHIHTKMFLMVMYKNQSCFYAFPLYILQRLYLVRIYLFFTRKLKKQKEKHNLLPHGFSAKPNAPPEAACGCSRQGKHVSVLVSLQLCQSVLGPPLFPRNRLLQFICSLGTSTVFYCSIWHMQLQQRSSYTTILSHEFSTRTIEGNQFIARVTSLCMENLL